MPWWLLLFNRGNAQINLTDLTIFIDNNGEAAVAPHKKTGMSPQAVKIVLPDYLSDAKYTLRAKNITIRDVQSGRRYFSVSKLLVREFQYGKNSAFEVNIPIEINHKTANYNSELWLFGDITPQLDRWDLNYRGEFRTRDTADKFQIEDIVIDGSASFNPAKVDIQSRLNLLIDKRTVGSGDLVAKNNELNVNLVFDRLPLSYLSLVGEEIKNPYLRQLDGYSQGQLSFSRSFDHESSAQLNGKLTFDGDFFLDPETKFPGKWQLSFENTKWETSFLSPKSEVSFFRRAFVDFNNGTLSQYAEELGFSGVDAKIAMLPIQGLHLLVNVPHQSYFSTLISLKKCLDGDKIVEGTFRYGRTPQDSFYQASLTNEGTLQLNFLKNEKSSSIDLTFNKFQWKSYIKFLDSYFTADAALLDGKISGRWSKEWGDGQWLNQLKGVGLKNVKGYWSELNQQLFSSFDIDYSNTPDVDWNIQVAKDEIRIKSVSVNGTSPVMISGLLKANGLPKSFLILNHPKNKKVKPVKKEIKEIFWKKDI